MNKNYHIAYKLSVTKLKTKLDDCSTTGFEWRIKAML